LFDSFDWAIWAHLLHYEDNIRKTLGGQGKNQKIFILAKIDGKNLFLTFFELEVFDLAIFN